MSGGPDREAVERLLDVAVYAPLGLALLAKDHWGEWAARGRQQVGSRVPLARMVGQMVLDRGAREAHERLGEIDDLPQRMVEGAIDVVTDLAVLVARAVAGGDGEADHGAEGGAGDDDAPERQHGAGHNGTGPEGRGPAPTPSGSATDLAIPGYDTLSASQVVQRLPGLSIAELDAIGAYEASRRGRKTILLKVAQLRASP